MGLPRVPRPDEVAIFVHAKSGQVGPLSRRAIRERVDAGELAVSDHLWMEGMAAWEKMSTIEGFFDGLDQQPLTSPRREGESEEDYQERVFGGLVQGSWDYLSEHSFASHIDEVFLGAVITSTLDTGYSLIDLRSDGSHHFLRFENLEDHSRILFRLTHLTPSLAIAKVLGQRASAIVGYGEKVGNISKIMNAIRAEVKSGYIDNADPGTITVDGDINTGYVTCQVDLFLKIDDYVAPDYTIDHASLSAHIAACKHALRKYLRGRFA